MIASQSGPLDLVATADLLASTATFIDHRKLGIGELAGGPDLARSLADGPREAAATRPPTATPAAIPTAAGFI